MSFLNNSIFDKIKGLLGHEKATLIDLYFFLLKQSLSHFKNKDKGLGPSIQFRGKTVAYHARTPGSNPQCCKNQEMLASNLKY